MVSVEPTKAGLNKHNIRLPRIYFHLNLLIEYFTRTAGLVLGHKIANDTAFYLGYINAVSFYSPALSLP